MKRLLLTGLLACFVAICNSQTTKDSCDLKVCVVNKSSYLIDRIIINNTLNIDSLAPNAKSDFKCSKSLFATFSYAITFTRKNLFGGNSQTRIFSQPRDHVKEKEIKDGRLKLYLTIEKNRKNKFEIHFEIKKLTTGVQTE